MSTSLAPGRDPDRRAATEAWKPSNRLASRSSAVCGVQCWPLAPRSRHPMTLLPEEARCSSLLAPQHYGLNGEEDSDGADDDQQ